jgi:hypothetical protein
MPCMIAAQRRIVGTHRELLGRETSLPSFDAIPVWVPNLMLSATLHPLRGADAPRSPQRAPRHVAANTELRDSRLTNKKPSGTFVTEGRWGFWKTNHGAD